MQNNNQLPSSEQPKTEKKKWVAPTITVFSKDIVQIGSTTGAEGVQIPHGSHYHTGSGS